MKSFSNTQSHPETSFPLPFILTALYFKLLLLERKEKDINTYFCILIRDLKNTCNFKKLWEETSEDHQSFLCTFFFKKKKKTYAILPHTLFWLNLAWTVSSWLSPTTWLTARQVMSTLSRFITALWTNPDLTLRLKSLFLQDIFKMSWMMNISDCPLIHPVKGLSDISEGLRSLGKNTLS